MTFTAFFRRPRVWTFLAFTTLYAVCLGFVFGGTWSTSVAAVQPDAGCVYPLDWMSRAWHGLFSGANLFLPADIFELSFGPWAMQELKYALAVYCAALGLAYYLRGRGVPLIAAYGGGAAYGLMGYTLSLFSAGHVGWFCWLTYGPFAFGLTDRAVRKGRWKNWALLGAVLAWGAARQPDLWLLFTALTFAYGVWCLVRERRTLKARPGVARLAWGIGLTVLVTALVGAPSFLSALTESLAGRDKQIADSAKAAGTDAQSADPAQKAKAEAERWNFCTGWSLPPEDMLEFAIPRLSGDTCDGNIIALRKQAGWRETTPYTGRLGMPVPGPDGQVQRWMPYRQHALYFGFITLAFALFALMSVFRPTSGSRSATVSNRGEMVFWLSAVVVSLLCALGCFTPFYRLVYALPFGSYLRAPVKFVHLTEFAAAALAGFGAAAALERFRARAAWGVVGALLVVNAIDLARIDALYLGPQNVSFQRAENQAADDAVKAGSGKVAVLVPPQEGGQMIEQSFNVHLMDTADLRAAGGDPFRAGARFLFLTAKTLAQQPALNQQLKEGRLRMAGTYGLSQQKGIFRVPGNQAQAALLEIPGAPQGRTEPPPPAPLKRAFNYLSFVSTLAVLGIGFASSRSGRK